MSKSAKNNSSGFAPVILLVLVAVIAFSGYEIYKSNKPAATIPLTQNILGEEDSGESEIKNETSKPESKRTETSKLETSSRPMGSPKARTSEKPETETAKSPEPSESPENETETTEEVKDGSKSAIIKIRSGNNQFEFQQEGTEVQVQSELPVSVNQTTRELTVTTPAGSKVVAILPQVAVDNMISAGILSTSTNIQLQTETNSDVTYRIEGNQHKKLFGLIPVSVPKTVSVSARTGEVTEVNQSALSKLLDNLSD